MNRERAERGSGGPQPHNRLSGGYRSTPPSPRPPIPSASGPQPGVSPADRNSPLSGRGGAYIPHHPQGSPSPSPGSGPASPYTPASPGGQASTPTSATAAPSPSSPPSSHGHSVPHSHSLPHSLSEAARTVNGGMFGKLRYDVWTMHSTKFEFTSKTVWCFFAYSFQCLPEHPQKPKDLHNQEQSVLQIRLLSLQVRSGHLISSHLCINGGSCLISFLCLILSATRSPKSASSQDTPYLDTSSVSLPTQKTSGPAPLFPVDGIH